MKTIYYEKRTGNVVVNNTVTFDPVYGDQTKVGSYKWGVLHDEMVFQGLNAFAKANTPIWSGKTLSQLIPEIGPVPKRRIGINLWKSILSFTPTPSPINYRARRKLSENSWENYIIECRTEADVQIFYDLKIDEFCLITDFPEIINNENYDQEVSDRNAKIQELRGLFSRMFFDDSNQTVTLILLARSIFPVIPDTDGYRWYEVNQANSKVRIEIPVTNDFKTPYRFVVCKHPDKYYLSSLINTLVLTPKDDILKRIFQL